MKGNEMKRDKKLFSVIFKFNICNLIRTVYGKFIFFENFVLCRVAFSLFCS